MKTKLFILIAMFISMAAFSQKNELKAAEKALKGGDPTAAKASLDAISGSISGADERLQAQYYFVRGQVFADLAKKGDASAFDGAVKAYQEVLKVEETSGKKKGKRTAVRETTKEEKSPKETGKGRRRSAYEPRE